MASRQPNIVSEQHKILHSRYTNGNSNCNPIYLLNIALPNDPLKHIDAIQH